MTPATASKLCIRTATLLMFIVFLILVVPPLNVLPALAVAVLSAAFWLLSQAVS